MTAAYEIGKHYLVPTVKAKVYGRERYWPLLTPIHEDREIIGFQALHAHVDPRFLTKRDWDWYISSPYKYVAPQVLRVFSAPICFGEGTLNPSKSAQAVVMKNMTFKREMPPYPVGAARWEKALDAAYGACRITGMVCPHRGTDLSTLPVVDGVVVCPAHGLQWRVATGELVPHEALTRPDRTPGG